MLGVILGVFLAITAGTAYAAYRYDQGNLGRILPGVTVMGIDVGGLSRDQAMQKVKAEVDKQLSHPISVEAAGHTWHTSAADLHSKADIAPQVDKALAITESLPWTSRVYHRLLSKPVEAENLNVGVTLDKSEIVAFVAKVGGAVGEAPVNGGYSLNGNNLVYAKSKPGLELDDAKALSIVRTALREDKSSIKFPVKKVAPETVGDDKTIVVSLGQEKLTLYEGKKADRTYPVATGAPGFPTPTGSFQIVEKRKNPTWVNPDPTGWGSSMPASIPPGPGNPLGTRAMNLNAPGIRIHGTYELSSLGTAASHGCIRMAISDSEQLYDLVNVGTPVLIMK